MPTTPSRKESHLEPEHERIEFFGHVFSSQGVSPDLKMVSALKDSPPPSNAEELRSFVGLATYCERFIPNLATIGEPLRRLTRESVQWKWGTQEQEAFAQIQNSIVQNCTMAYFEPKKQTELIVDASPFGLGTLLTQRNAKGKTNV